MSNPYETGSKQMSVLGPTIKIKGELQADEDLLIEGRVEGTIEHTQSLTIGKEGSVKADIRAKYITVEGTVDGDLKGNKAVLINSSGVVNGNVFAPSVSLVEGARFNGSIDMDSPPVGQSASPEAADGTPAKLKIRARTGGK